MLRRYAAAPAVAGFLRAKGEDPGRVPPSAETSSPASLFTAEKGRRR